VRAGFVEKEEEYRWSTCATQQTNLLDLAEYQAQKEEGRIANPTIQDPGPWLLSIVLRAPGRLTLRTVAKFKIRGNEIIFCPFFCVNYFLFTYFY
jgi:hypothetical protein